MKKQFPDGGALGGLRGQDHMECWAMSTLALLFSLVHWPVTLDKEFKANAIDMFEALVNQSLGFGKRVMFIKPDTKCGVINDSGCLVAIQNCIITDGRCLADISPVIKSAFKRNLQFHIFYSIVRFGLAIRILTPSSGRGAEAFCSAMTQLHRQVQN